MSHHRAHRSRHRAPRVTGHRGRARRFLCGAAAALVVAAGLTATSAAPASAALSGADADLVRAPYLTDVTSSSVRVTWATLSQSRGIVVHGPSPSCTGGQVQSATSGAAITVGTTKEFQNSVTLTGLTPGTRYCYRVRTATGADLLGSLPSPAFTTLDTAGSTAPVTFAVLGDWGDTTNSGVNDGTVNANQAGVMAQIAASGARFAVSTGDVAYPGGTQTTYGDVNQTGKDVSAVFGPQYWTVPGGSTPMFVASGNHGRNSTFLSVWPQPASSAEAGETYAMLRYPTVEGAFGTTAGATYPTSYYAFSANGARFYVLDAAWGDSARGTATGGTCGTPCAGYEVDHTAHWAPTEAEYRWLAADLAAHPDGLKFAFFHYPLRSDDVNNPGNPYLQWTPAGGQTLEKLLHDNGVRLVFNGHAHIYQRNVAPPGGVTSYVTGGGGAKATVVSRCKPTDAYAIGWSYSSSKGSACGAAPAPTSDSQIYHFLKVTVAGSTVTVTPTDSRGRTFDPVLYDFGADTAPPAAVGSLTAARPTTTSVKLTWTAATDAKGVSAYDVYRDGAYLATVTPSTLSWTDTVVAGTSATYRVDARDLAGNTTGATVTSSAGGAVDTTAPTAPTGLVATSGTPTSVALSWTAATDAVGVTGYTVLRNGTAVATTTTTSFGDAGLLPSTAYSYAVTARDAAGNISVASATANVTTLADTLPPTAPGTPVVGTVTSTQVPLSWTASTDDVAVARYDVLRNGAVVGTTTAPSFTDTTAQPGTTYSYAVRAYDTSSNGTTGGSVSVTTAAAATTLFTDDFETGDLSRWTTVSGLTMQSPGGHSGSFAAREVSAGTTTYAYATLPRTAGELWMQGWVNITSRSTSVNLFGYRTSTGGSIVNLYVDSLGRVSLRNNVGLVTTNSTTTVANGGWHRFVLHALVNGTASSLDVTMDGVAVPGLTLTGQNLGTAPIARLQLGETSAGRTYDVLLDDLVVSTAAL